MHSHVYWDAADPRAHHINFSDSDTMGESGKLTTCKVFAFSLPKGAATSFWRHIQEGVPERLRRRSHRAHTSSATLWSIFDNPTLWGFPKQISANFTGAFYLSFLEESKTVPDGGFIKIARLFQSAVKELEKEKKDTVLHWTSCILQGFWVLIMYAKDAKPLA